MSDRAIPYLPRGLSRDEAAHYIGVGIPAMFFRARRTLFAPRWHPRIEKAPPARRPAGSSREKRPQPGAAASAGDEAADLGQAVMCFTAHMTASSILVFARAISRLLPMPDTRS